MKEACTEQHEHDGPWFKYWRRRTAAGLGAIIPGEEPVPYGRFVPVLLDEDGYPT